MRLYSFQPSQGDFAGSTYIFPNPRDAQAYQVNYNIQDQTSTMSQYSGTWLEKGWDPMDNAGGDITETFIFSYAFLVVTAKSPFGPYLDNWGGVEDAVMDFMRAVVDGGVGTLRAIRGAGSRYGTAMAQADAIVRGTVTPAWGGDVVKCELTCPFHLPRGRWSIAGLSVPVH